MTGPARQGMIDITELVLMLTRNIDALVAAILPSAQLGDGKKTWTVGSVAGEPGRSLVIWRSPGNPRQAWKDFASGEGGDALELVSQVMCGGHKARAILWAKDYLGLDKMTPAQRALAHKQAKAQAERAAALAEKDEREKRDKAKGLWLSGVPELAGTPVEAYLAARGIDLSARERAPRAIRFHAELYCAELSTPENRVTLPAMVAAVSAPTGSFLAVHRTFLARQTDGQWGKHPDLKHPRKVWPGFAGGVIQLHRGETGVSLAAAANDGLADTVAITEGIEDALTGAQVEPAWRWMAGISLANLGNIRLPKTVTEIVLCADNDWDNDKAMDQFYRAQLALYQAHQCKVSVVRSPVGKDLNDALRGEL